MRNFSAASERNMPFIGKILKPILKTHPRVLEVGSGSGQHALAFASAHEDVVWQTTEQRPYIEALQANLLEYGNKDFPSPKPLTIESSQWVRDFATVDVIFTANTLHIMSWSSAQRLLAGAGERLETGGILAIYGPFNYAGKYTSESNAQFDGWLKARDPQSGIRHFEQVCETAKDAGLLLEDDIEMPANNRFLFFQKG